MINDKYDYDEYNDMMPMMNESSSSEVKVVVKRKMNVTKVT